MIACMRCTIEYANAQVEDPFRVIKRQFGDAKVRVRGLATTIAQQAKLRMI